MPRGTVLTVRAYAWDGCVTLRLNGKPVLQHARLPVAYEDEAHEADGSCVPVNSTTDFTATWQVPYQPGELSATLQSSPMEAVREAVVDAAAMPTVALRTVGPPTALRLRADRLAIRASRDDLSYITAEVIDDGGEVVECGSYNESAHGGMNTVDAALQHDLGSETHASVHASASTVPSPTAPPSWCSPFEITFHVDGDGELAAVGTGDPLDLSSFAASSRRSFRGRAMAIVRPGKTGAAAPPTRGELTLSADAPGLKGAKVVVTVG